MKLCLLLLLAGLVGPLAAQVSYTPQPITFGAVKLGQTSPILSSTLMNTGTDTLKFPGGSSMVGSPAFQYVTDNCVARPPGATCVLQYRFVPTTVGPLTGANLVGTSHGFFPLLFTGVGQDTATPPPLPPPGAPIVVGVQGSPISVTLRVGESYPVSAVPANALGQPVAVPVTWTSSAPTVATVRLPAPAVTQAAEVAGVSVGTATLTASAGGKSTTIGVTVTPPLPPPPPAPPVFGTRASFISQFFPVGCPATPGSTCIRGPLAVLADSDGHVQAQATVTVTFGPP